MKRSEIVDELSELIGMVRYEDAINKAGGASVVSADEYGEIILAKLERLGMLPPQIDNTHALSSGGYLGLDAALTRGLREWEPE
jgi:hypothetical protein